MNPLTVLRWLLSHWRAALAAVVLAAAAYGGYHYRDVNAQAEVAALKKQYADEKAAQAIAALAAVKKQERVSEDTDKRYQKRLADLRADFERRMRDRATSGSGVPAVPQSPVDADAAAEELAACQADYLDLQERAAEDAIQLDELQKWLRKQRKVNR